MIGLEISLPSLLMHQKVVNEVYNPAVDIGDGFDESTAFNNEPGVEVYDVIRDRISVPYKGNVYFERMDYVPSRAMDAYSDGTLSLQTLPSSAPGERPDQSRAKPKSRRPSIADITAQFNQTPSSWPSGHRIASLTEPMLGADRPYLPSSLHH